jgi:hypothetical protein
MKLASLEPLTPGFVRGLTERTSEDIEESHGRGKWESAAGPRDGAGSQNARNEALDDAGEELEFADDDLEGGSPEEDEEAVADIEVADDEMGADQMISVQDLMTAITAALEDVTGQPVESEIEDADIEDEEELDADLDAADSMEMDTDMEMADDEMLEEDGDKKGDESDEDLDYEKNESTKATDELVEQITKRVAARILKSALAKKK